MITEVKEIQALEKYDRTTGSVAEKMFILSPQRLFTKESDRFTRCCCSTESKNIFIRVPSERIRQQFGFTPFVFEQSNDELFIFSSDYPYTEGGRDPIASFESCMQTLPQSSVNKFNSGNFHREFART